MRARSVPSLSKQSTNAVEANWASKKRHKSKQESRCSLTLLELRLDVLRLLLFLLLFLFFLLLFLSLGLLLGGLLSGLLRRLLSGGLLSRLLGGLLGLLGGLVLGGGGLDVGGGSLSLGLGETQGGVDVGEKVGKTHCDCQLGDRNRLKMVGIER